jgi:hypothetical protein
MHCQIKFTGNRFIDYVSVVGYRRVVVFYTYSTPTKVAAVVCSGWAVLGRGPQGIVAGQSGASRVRCRNECRNECMNV